MSHPALEAIKSKTATYNLQTKLTGAGGGGCAVTLVPDGTYYYTSLLQYEYDSPLIYDIHPGFSEDSLKQLMSELSADGFEAYLTSVGGSGLGVLSPHPVSDEQAVSAYEAPVTPPDSPGSTVEVEGAVQSSSLRSLFENAASTDFGSWAEQRGRWLYV